MYGMTCKPGGHQAGRAAAAGGGSNGIAALLQRGAMYHQYGPVAGFGPAGTSIVAPGKGDGGARPGYCRGRLGTQQAPAADEHPGVIQLPVGAAAAYGVLEQVGYRAVAARLAFSIALIRKVEQVGQGVRKAGYQPKLQLLLQLRGRKDPLFGRGGPAAHMRHAPPRAAHHRAYRTGKVTHNALRYYSHPDCLRG